MPEQTLFISEWDQQGQGLGTHVLPDGKSVLVAVPGSIVGESVAVSTITKSGKGPVRRKAFPTAILHPSAGRVTPVCQHFGLCGGCVWQHMSYNMQLATKQQWIESLFTPLVADTGCIRPVIGSECVFAYRNKMEFSFSQDRAGARFLGLFGSRGRVVSLDTCHLVRPWMGALLGAVRSWWERSELAAYNWRRNEGTLETLTLREGITTGDKMVVLTVSGNPQYAPKRCQLDAFCDTVKSVVQPSGNDLSIVLCIRQIAPKKPTLFYDMILFGKDHVEERLAIRMNKERRLDVHIGPHSFFQPHTLQAQKIYEKALAMARLGENETVLDLYCGIGLFGMFAAQEVKKSIGIELSREAAYDATTNAQRLGLGNFSVQAGDVAAVLKNLPDLRPDTVIVDPPRAGLQKALEHIVALQPQKLVYVSCNPKTQAEDAERLTTFGWHITGVQPVDQFPHTPHVENILVLERGT